MPSFGVQTSHCSYPIVVERGALARLAEFVPAKAGRIFVATNEEVWKLHGAAVSAALHGRPVHVLRFPPGEERKRFASVEAAAEEMIAAGGDRTSVVIAVGGGIVNDMGGFLAAIFMRGIPVIQVPTTLLAQVDAAVGGKTGVNLRSGKNLIGAFHQPLAVVTDPELLQTLPEREYRAGLFEVIKHGVIASPELFRLMQWKAQDVFRQEPAAVEFMVAESVRIKSRVVSEDEREGGLRRILNFGHTVGHALEAETGYGRLLHGEAVGFGMIAAAHLASLMGVLPAAERDEIVGTVALYGPVPSIADVSAEALVARLVSDKKTIQGKVHFVLPDRIGHVVIRSDADEAVVLQAVRTALAS